MTSGDLGAVAGELREWLGEHWDPDLTLLEWRRRLAESGWATPTWPARWGGRDLPASAASVVARTLAEFGAVGPPDGVGMTLAAPTLLEHGSDPLNDRFLPPTVTGELSWCQLFSEPGAGSDLAGLTTRAELVDGEWRVSGQKVWNTSAHHADVGLLVARTDWDVPKHRGLTYFVLPMKQPGVEVRPLRQANGHSSFNEVFFDDARIPADQVVGEVGGGWAVALTTLAHERRANLASTSGQGRTGRVWDEAREEAQHLRAPYKWYPQRAGRVDLLVPHALASGRGEDSVVRQELARAVTLAWVTRWTAERAAAARKLGKPPGPEGSLAKLGSSNVARAAARAHAAIAAGGAMLAGADGGFDGTIAEILLSVPAVSIAGGTDEIQRNIISERVLGLPKDPTLDPGVPFRDVPKNRS
jgi:alkylation response protein AidB-like acyl-CoA dehydrogenase